MRPQRSLRPWLHGTGAAPVTVSATSARSEAVRCASTDTSGGASQTPRSASPLSLHQVGRLLRRLPVGRTHHTFFFNELAHPVKKDVVAQLHKRACRRRQTAAGSPAVGMRGWLGGRTVLQLPAPRLGLPPERVLKAHTTATRKAVQRLSQGLHEEVWDGRGSVRRSRDDCSLKAETTGGPRDEGASLRAALRMFDPAREDRETGLEEGQVLVPETGNGHTSVKLRLVDDWPPATRGGTWPAVMLSTECTAPRVNYLSNPEVYMLGVPAELLGDSQQDGGDGATDVEAFLERRLMYDPRSGLLLLLRPTDRSEHGPRDGLAAEDGIFLSQLFSFDAATAHHAATVAISDAPAASDAGHGRRPRYRLFFLSMPPADVVDAGSVYPSCFAGYTVDVPTTTRLLHAAGIAASQRGDSASSSSGGISDALPTTFSHMHERMQRLAAAAPLWTPLSVRRLTVQAKGDARGANLWATQLSPTGDKDTARLSRDQRRALTTTEAASLETERGEPSAADRYLRTVAMAFNQRRAVARARDVAVEDTDLSAVTTESGVGGSEVAARGRIEAAAGVGPIPTPAALLRRLFSPRVRAEEGPEEAAARVAAAVRGPKAVVRVTEARPHPRFLTSTATASEFERLVSTVLHTGRAPTCGLTKQTGVGVAVEEAAAEEREKACVTLPTAIDASTAACEGPLRQLLLAPVEVPSTPGADQRLLLALAAHSPDKKPRWLHRLADVDDMSGWRRRGHSRRFGSLKDVLGASSSPTLPSAALLLGTSRWTGREGGSGSPLVFLRDEAFVELVLLPAMRVFAEERLRGIDSEGAEEDSHVTCARASTAPETVFDRYLARAGDDVSPGSDAVACAVHHHRITKALHAASRRLVSRDPVSKSGAPSRLPMSWPFLARSVREAAARVAAATPRDKPPPQLTRTLLGAGVAAVPILPFLAWAAETCPAGRFSTSPAAPPPAGQSCDLHFTAEDVVALLAFFAHFDEHFDVFAGNRTTVALRMAASGEGRGRRTAG